MNPIPEAINIIKNIPTAIHLYELINVNNKHNAKTAILRVIVPK